MMEDMNTLHETIVSFETAKLLKEIGFNIAQNQLYNRAGRFIENSRHSALLSQDMGFTYPAPTQCLAQKFIREKHKLHIVVEYKTDVHNRYYLKVYNLHYILYSEDNFSNYEEAFEKGLQESLKLIKED